MANSFSLTQDNGYIVVGSKVIGNTNGGFICKINNIGNIEWTEIFDYSHADVFTNILQTQDNGYIISGYTENSYGYSRWYIVRTDSLGNQIWDWVLPNPYSNLYADGAVADLIQTQDGNFVAVGGQTYFKDYYTLQKARLLKFDINKNVLLDTLFNEEFQYTSYAQNSHSHFVKIKQKNNGNLILINTKQSTPDINPAFNYPILYEYDNNFNIVKRREFKAVTGKYQGYYLKDLIIEPNGSITFIGNTYLNSSYYNPYQRVWFVKTDTNYCDGFGSCDTTFNVELNYPDTVSKKDTFNIDLEVISNLNIEYDIIINYYSINNGYFFINRDTIFNVLPYDIQHIPMSFNILEELNLFPNDNPISDTIRIKYEVSPSDGISHMDKFSFLREHSFIFKENVWVKPLEKQQAMIRVYPNPTSGKIKVEADGIERIELMDLQGRTVLSQKTKDKDQKYDLDLSSQAKGIYFIKVTTAKGVAVEKVIKE